MSDMNIFPTSWYTAGTDPLTLRETSTTRIVFEPQVVHNAKTGGPSVKGRVIIQRKPPKETWASQQVPALDLGDMKAGQGFQLQLHSDEVLKLVERVRALYETTASGMPRVRSQYVRIDSDVAAILKPSEKELRDLLNDQPGTGAALLGRLLRWVAQIEDVSGIIDRLEALDATTAQHINTAFSVARLQRLLATWREHYNNPDEAFWQGVLSENTFALGQIFSYPVVLVRGKAYLGGKAIDNQGGTFGDLLLKNKLTMNAILVEIKTPRTDLLGGSYRGLWAPSHEMSGAVVQVMNQRRSFAEDFLFLNRDGAADVSMHYPRCLLVAGNTSVELKTEEKRRSFELFRGGLRDVEVVGYDELFGKVDALLGVLQGGSAS